MNGRDDQGAEFVAVASLAEMPDGKCRAVIVEGHSLVVVRDGDRVHALQATCPHEKADLLQGRIEAGRLICPRHLASFSLADGQVSRGWTVEALKLYPAKIIDGAVLVDVAAVRRDPPGGARKVWDLS